MTVSDLILRLQELQKKIGSGAAVKIGKAKDNPEETFEFFETRRIENEIVLMPTSIWDRKKHD